MILRGKREGASWGPAGPCSVGIETKKVLDKLEEHGHRYREEYAGAASDDVIKKLELEQTIVATQIKKARKILKSLY